ncbi:autophagy-related protein 13 isoform X2 [Ischnura elegans]|uniref:autophagy-related protein 13 isoform X2 n=1 Tax=Ischnura elegans TaxID=197161 RepID=UPI001ED8AF13|nr:autophagy-related protein 13 isoform X2 [Ischnura elegans]
MASVKLSAQDRKELDKFTKFLALKAVQIIIQSRLGEKVKTKCKPNSSGTDWFNLAIRDLPDVASEAKKVLHGASGMGWDIPSGGPIHSTLGNQRRSPLCVEISLRTAEGESLALEAWRLGFMEGASGAMAGQPSSTPAPPTTAMAGGSSNPSAPSIDGGLTGGIQGSPPPPQRLSHSVYNRMGLLLRSLLSVTRVTPAYRLSRRQGPDSYVICYRIFLGEPQIHLLGDGYNEFRIGQLSTPLGVLNLSVAYRTKMTISPQHTGVGIGVTAKGETASPSIMVKSDHFRPDLSPPHRSPVSHKMHEKGISVGLQNGNSTPKYVNGCSNGMPTKCRDSFGLEGKYPKGNDKIKMGAFADVIIKPNTILTLANEVDPEPFSSLLSRPVPAAGQQNGTSGGKKCTDDCGRDKNGMPPEIQEVEEDKYSDSEKRGEEGEGGLGSRRSSLSGASGAEDFILVDLTTPFAGPNASSDLGSFYRECQTAPPLETFKEQPSLADQVKDLPKQLEAYEASQSEFDQLVASLLESPSETN